MIAQGRIPFNVDGQGLFRYTVSAGVWRSLVARMVWDHEADSSSLSTPTTCSRPKRE